MKLASDMPFLQRERVLGADVLWIENLIEEALTVERRLPSSMSGDRFDPPGAGQCQEAHGFYRPKRLDQCG